MQRRKELVNVSQTQDNLGIYFLIPIIIDHAVPFCFVMELIQEAL